MAKFMIQTPANHSWRENLFMFFFGGWDAKDDIGMLYALEGPNDKNAKEWHF
ncbi:hypothetical protein MTR_7g093960 [Medicago truncatula]|uniref:Uncharacterized protein n=1 Tax=Medicago truncatula TaxID=3880 RepID=G7KWD6_MEDTR|nr:hypothetical protein MTR_7g093960 [Medicago truncatula]